MRPAPCRSLLLNAVDVDVRGEDGSVQQEKTRSPWIWEHALDNSARFVLGTRGQNPLVCFGINPSTAVPGAPDPTVKRLMSFAAANGYDSWTMLNIYPRIATDPNDMDREHRADLKSENERHIAALLAGRPLTLLAAWGNLIAKRPYLKSLLADLVMISAAARCDWVSLGAPTRQMHPRHPLYVKGGTPLRRFDMDEYLRRLE